MKRTTQGEKIPAIILGGSDRKSAELPASGKDKHPLSGCKGADVLIGGRPIIQSVAERLAETDRFGPIYIAGPADVYNRIPTGATLIDTDGSFGENIQNSLEAVRAAHPGRPISFMTCDILPDVRTLNELIQDYRRQAPCDLWFPLPRAPEEPGKLGAFGWKPLYRIVPREGEPAVPVLPGHWAIVDPEALRLDFLYRLFQVGYRTRNRPIDKRRAAMVRDVVLELIRQDLLHVLGLRLPSLTWTVLGSGIVAGSRLRDGKLTRAGLEDAMRKIFVKARHRRNYPRRRILTPLVEGLFLGLDVDTEEEARQIDAESEAVSG